MIINGKGIVAESDRRPDSYGCRACHRPEEGVAKAPPWGVAQV